jgi:diaminopimelate epimerase
MAVRFTKMHGLGNDYVYVDLRTEHVADAPALARAISDRHRGVGSDGLILIAPPNGADAQARPSGGADAHAGSSGGAAHVRMVMYNADGSRAQMCGNGIRCVAKYAYDHGLTRANPLRVATDRGVLTLELTLGPDGRVAAARVDMGAPLLEPAAVPVKLPGPRVVDQPVEVAGQTLRLTCVSMGNPHAVVYVPDLGAVPLSTWGPALERHTLFPERVNAHFVQVRRPDYVEMLTWERGSGPTQACGTGASAVCVAGVLTQRTGRQITARLPGGELQLAWDAGSDHVFMTGPATEVFSGTWPD